MRFCVVFAGGGPGGREPPRDKPRDPKRKKEKPREVKILWNSSAKPGTGGHTDLREYCAIALTWAARK